MLFTAKESLEDSIVRLLSKGKSSPAGIHDALRKEGKKGTLQAIYKALRYLVKEAVIVKSGKEMAISQEWIEKIEASLTQNFSLSSMANGESLVYSFHSLAHLDAYWKHIVKPLQDQYIEYPVFHYNPYQIWHRIDERLQSEIDYFGAFEKNKQYGFSTVGNDTPMDQRFKKSFQNDYLQIDTWSKTPFRDTDYFSIVQEYIIITKLNSKLAHEIAEVYRTISSEAEMEQKLSKLLHQKNKAKIIVERNSKKAKVLRKKLFKKFYLPKTVQAKYRLFE